MKKHFEIELNISAEKAWEKLVGEFADIGKWAAILTSSYMEGELKLGGTRVCMVGDKKSTEDIIELSPETMTFGYRATSGLPSWMLTAENHYQIKSISAHKCIVISEPIVEVKWFITPILPIMSLSLNIMIKKAFEEMKYWAETGNPHPRKVAANNKQHLKSIKQPTPNHKMT